MESGIYGVAPLNLLLVVLVFGLLLLWSELWRKPVVREAVAKGPRPLKPKTGADCVLCQAEHGASIGERSCPALLGARRWIDVLNQNSATWGHGVGWKFCGVPDRGSGPDEHGLIAKYFKGYRLYMPLRVDSGNIRRLWTPFSSIL